MTVLLDGLAGPVLLYGAGITNRAVARAFAARGVPFAMADDRATDETSDFAEALGARCHRPDSADEIDALVTGASLIVPTPGLAESHAVFDATRRHERPMCSEFDLASVWDDRPCVAITGTNGKTTVTTLVTRILTASGVVATEAGNTEVPLVEAIDDPAVEVFVVEASSFRLAHSVQFAARVGTWLNFAPDHLDVHRDLSAYESAKASIWSRQGHDDVAVANLDDEIVAGHAAVLSADGPRLVTYGSGDRSGAGYHVADGALRRPDGSMLIRVTDLRRSHPHDLSNALAAAATAEPVGASPRAVSETLEGFGGLGHRVQFVGERGGISWFDDSKSTTPHSTRAAASAFDSVVLIAGGRNKGLDLRVLGELASVRAAVGIGESAAEVAAAFDHLPHAESASMDEAVEAAARLARPGDAVLLSPGCASFDWYRDYAERGDAFVASVRRLVLHADALTSGTEHGS